MKTLLVIFLSLLSFNLFAVEQTSNLHLSVEARSGELNILQYYTYLETKPLIYKGKNVFGAMSFRGDDARLELSADYSKLIFFLGSQKMILADVNLDIDGFKDESIETLVFEGALSIKLVKASLGKSFKIKKKTCFPGERSCSFSWVSITPYQYSFEVISTMGDILCIKRGYNTNSSNYGKNSDQYRFGHCLL